MAESHLWKRIMTENTDRGNKRKTMLPIFLQNPKIIKCEKNKRLSFFRLSLSAHLFIFNSHQFLLSLFHPAITIPDFATYTNHIQDTRAPRISYSIDFVNTLLTYKLLLFFNLVSSEQK